MKWLWIVGMLVTWPVMAQTYLGVLTTPANNGPGGSCCNWVVTLDVTNAAVPVDGSCPVGCQVITQPQYQAYLDGVANHKAATMAKCSPGVITSDGTHLNICTQDGKSLMQYNASVLGVPTTVTPPVQ